MTPDTIVLVFDHATGQQKTVAFKHIDPCGDIEVIRIIHAPRETNESAQLY